MKQSLFYFILFILVSIQWGFTQTFNNLERALITSNNKQSALPVILNTSDVGKKILSTPCTDIDINDPLLPILKERMYLTVRDSANDGVGIAAPQVGVNRNLCWVQRFDKPGEPFEFYINPRILWYSTLKQKGPEGCLSIPDIRGEVIRSYAINISYFKEDGSYYTESVEGFTAVIFQHEYDHLSGILFPERIATQMQYRYKPAADEKRPLLIVE